MSMVGRAEKGSDPESSKRERAERVRAMLERWAREDVASEPDWDVEDAPRVDLRSGRPVPPAQDP